MDDRKIHMRKPMLGRVKSSTTELRELEIRLEGLRDLDGLQTANLKVMENTIIRRLVWVAWSASLGALAALVVLLSGYC